jgi:hypothetical protein
MWYKGGFPYKNLDTKFEKDNIVKYDYAIQVLTDAGLNPLYI